MTKVIKTIYGDEEAFKAEYLSLLPAQGQIVFSHNDTQENNFLSNGQETKIIDFEYSCANYMGVDLASYLNETSLNYDPTLPNKYAYEPERKPNFGEKVEGETRAHVDSILKVYLSRLWEIKQVGHKDEFIEKELPVFRETIKKLTLSLHLFWIPWCLIMCKGSLIDPSTDKPWTDTDKMRKALEEIGEFYVPYALTRLEMYFEQRKELLGEESVLNKD